MFIGIEKIEVGRTIQRLLQSRERNKEKKNVKNNKTKYNLNHKIHEKYYVFIVVLKTKF